MTVTTQEPAAPAELLDVQAVAQLLKCSSRTVWRFADAGKMPNPIRIGVMVRWRRDAIASWITSNCQPVERIGICDAYTLHAGPSERLEDVLGLT
jgi:predicted DNA-binding transcriptional regulator AlpA